MNKEIKENLTGLMITLGTDTERKFAGVYEKLIIVHLFVFIKEKMDILNLVKMILLQLFQ